MQKGNTHDNGSSDEGVLREQYYCQKSGILKIEVDGPHLVIEWKSLRYQAGWLGLSRDWNGFMSANVSSDARHTKEKK